MPEWLGALLPGLLAGVASAVGSLAAIKSSVSGLFKRVGRLEECALENQRALGRLEGRFGKDGDL
jgi:hypothetical protein